MNRRAKKKLPGSLLLVVGLICLSGQPGPAAETEELISAGADWCGTQRIFEQKYQQKFGLGPVPEACDQHGPCDAPIHRDPWIPEPGEPVQYIRMIIHVLALDDGSRVYSSPEDIAAQVEQLNDDYAQAGIQFVYTVNQVNSSAWRTLAESEINELKTATAIEPDRYLNVWVTVVDFNYSFGTYPWSYDALLPTGGIVMGHFHWRAGEPNRVFAHEVGHCLGLWHTFHGVDEVAACGPCYETPGSNSPLIGDLCADSPPTPTNSGPCTDYGGNDPCSGLPWGYTMPENYMGYASQTCLTTFTPEQRGRMRCWSNTVLDSWVIPFRVQAGTTLGPAPLSTEFTATTHKPATGWSWDFGDGQVSHEQFPSHTYFEPGLRTVAVDLQTTTASYHEEYPGLVGVYADTLDVSEGIFVGTVGRADIYVRNYLPLKAITIPFRWNGPIDADFDHASSEGLRSSDMTLTQLSVVPAWNAATIHLDAGSGAYLEPGSGPVASLCFTLNGPGTAGSLSVQLWDYAIYDLGFAAEAGDYRPVACDGSIRISCCQGLVGDANSDGLAYATIGDITALIDHLFISEAPLECWLEADINQSGGLNPTTNDITIGDITMLIDHLFVSGIDLPDCP